MFKLAVNIYIDVKHLYIYIYEQKNYRYFICSMQQNLLFPGNASILRVRLRLATVPDARQTRLHSDHMVQSETTQSLGHRITHTSSDSGLTEYSMQYSSPTLR